MNSTLPASGKSQTETEKRILDAAEYLFAEHGFEGTSLRMITTRADVNLAAVNYHFGGKESLFQEVFQRRLAQLNKARVLQLDAAEAQAQGSVLKPSQILECFFSPALEMAADTEGGGYIFMRLLGRTYTEPAQFVRQFLAEGYADVARRYLDALYKSLPDVPRNEIAWRFHFMMGAVSYAFSGMDTLALFPESSPDAPELLKPRLVAFLLGGLRAPLPDFSAAGVTPPPHP